MNRKTFKNFNRKEPTLKEKLKHTSSFMVALGRVEHMSEVMTNWNFAKGKRTGNKAYFIIACHTMHLTELFT